MTAPDRVSRYRDRVARRRIPIAILLATAPAALAAGCGETTDHAAMRPPPVQKVAQGRGIPMAQLALAWVLSKPVVSAPIVGATKPHHLADAVAALDVALTDDEIQMLEEPYTPQALYWF